MSTLPAGSKPWLHDVARGIARVLHRPVYRVGVVGTERIPRNGPVIVVANHSSLIEPQLIFGAVPRRSVFLVKEEMFGGIKGPALRAIGQLAIRRGEPDRAPLLEAIRILKAGGVIGIFPEGSRGAGDVALAEQGAAWLVRAANATVVPIAVRGTHRPEGVRRRFRPRVDLLVGQPFSLEVGKGRAGLVDATELIRTQLAELVRTLDALREERKRS